MKWVRGSFWVYDSTGKKRKRVSGATFGPYLGINRALLKPEHFGWVVSHLPTGHCITGRSGVGQYLDRPMSQRRAKAIVEALADMPCWKWKTTNRKRWQSVAGEVTRRIRAVTEPAV